MTDHAPIHTLRAAPATTPPTARPEESKQSPIARSLRDPGPRAAAIIAPVFAAAALGSYAYAVSGAPSLILLLCICGVCFALYAPPLLWIGRGGSPGKHFILCLWGLMFPIWGFVLAFVTAVAAGIFGWPHSILTGVVLGRITRSRNLGFGVALAILPAWVLAVVIDGSFRFGFQTFPLAATTWNVLVSAMLALWALHNRGLDLLDSDARAGLCTGCGYDLRGTTPGSACPECGAARASSP